MLNDWIRAQRIGLAAYWLGRSTRATTGLSAALAFLEHEIEIGQKSHVYFIQSLPPIVLNLLSSIPAGIRQDSTLLDPRQYREILEQKLGIGVKNRIPQFVDARVLAYHILQATTTPIAIFRLARSLFGNHWRSHEDNADCREGLQAALKILRSPWKETSAKIDAIEVVGKLLPNTRGWKDVESVLYHQMFSWPLLVFAENAISLPVGIDIVFDDEEKIYFWGGKAIDVSRWEQDLRKAAKVARKMWRAKHGNYGSFRDKVKGASVIYDFRVADAIVAGFPEPLGLGGSSMQVYFCQVVLSRLLGNPVSLARIATGSIGAETPKQFADYEFEWALNVPDKLNYVFQTQSFEKIILPNLSNSRKQPHSDGQLRQLKKFFSKVRNNQSAEINFVERLQNVADSFQAGGWRQHRYIRCPEIAWCVHPSHEDNKRAVDSRLPPPHDSAVITCLEKLANNQTSVLTLPPEVTSLDLAAALWHINTVLREGPRLPPMISWAFIRAVPGEEDSRFWQVVWETTGATLQEFEDFHRTATPESAARLLSSALNCFSPHERSRGHRAPDLLVLLDVESLTTSFRRAKNPLARPHAFEAIMEHLPGMLSPIVDERMKNLIGPTRIIMFQSDRVAENFSQSSQAAPDDIERAVIESLSYLRLSPDEQEQLVFLSVFRFGFTQQMASLLWANLDLHGLQVRRQLRRYVNRGLLRYGSGEYHMTEKVRQFLHSFESEAEPKLHYAAAIALAPYLSSGDVPGLAFDEAFRAVHVHEANYHWAEALKALYKTHGNPFLRTVRSAYSSLLRFAEYPGWNVVNQLGKIKSAKKDAYEMATDLLDKRRESGLLPHPEHLLISAKATEGWWQELRSSLKNEGRPESLVNEINALFDEAEDACENSIYKSEREYNFARVLSRRAAFLHKNRTALPQINVDSKFRELSEEVLKLFRNTNPPDSTAAPAEWYEFAGDDVRDSKEAAEIYRLGLKSQPDFTQLWVKLIGTSCLGFGNPRVLDDLCEQLPSVVEQNFQYLNKVIRRDSEICKPWVKPRWASAIHLLLGRYDEAPEIKKHLQLCDKELRNWRST